MALLVVTFYALDLFTMMMKMMWVILGGLGHPVIADARAAATAWDYRHEGKLKLQYESELVLRNHPAGEGGSQIGLAMRSILRRPKDGYGGYYAT
jgi:hypothetical protein